MNPSWERNIQIKTSGTYIKCNYCNLESPLFDPQNVEIFFCPKCNCIHSKNHSDYDKIAKNKKPPFNPLIPLYSVAIIEEVKYTVISAILKQEKGDKYARWEEYTLMCDTKEFVYLSHYNGHWIMLEEWKEPKNYAPKCKEFVGDDGDNYVFFSSYQPLTINALGEFSEDVINSKGKIIQEFINPPYIFSIEANGSNRTTYAGEYIKQNELAKLFPDLSLALPPREGVGSCQPFYFGINPRRFYELSVILILIFIPYLIFFSSPSDSSNLVSIETRLTDSIRTQELVSPSFQLKGTLPQVLRMELYSSVENDWVSAEVELVNEKTGEEKAFFNDIEYYSGYDDEGSWSEGSTKKTAYLNSIDPGLYHIEATISGSSSNRFTTYSLQVFADTPTTSNYLVLMGILTGICVLIYFVNKNFENRRYGITTDWGDSE